MFVAGTFSTRLLTHSFRELLELLTCQGSGAKAQRTASKPTGQKQTGQNPTSDISPPDVSVPDISPPDRNYLNLGQGQIKHCQ